MGFFCQLSNFPRHEKKTQHFAIAISSHYFRAWLHLSNCQSLYCYAANVVVVGTFQNSVLPNGTTDDAVPGQIQITLLLLCCLSQSGRFGGRGLTFHPHTLYGSPAYLWTHFQIPSVTACSPSLSITGHCFFSQYNLIMQASIPISIGFSNNSSTKHCQPNNPENRYVCNKMHDCGRSYLSGSSFLSSLLEIWKWDDLKP